MLNLTNLQTKGYDELIEIDIAHITIQYQKINWIRLKIMR